MDPSPFNPGIRGNSHSPDEVMRARQRITDEITRKGARERDKGAVRRAEGLERYGRGGGELPAGCRRALIEPPRRDDGVE